MYSTHFKKNPLVKELQKEFSLFKNLGLLSISGGILEEVIFRRWIMDTLQSLNINIIFQILISGLTFGLIHLIWGLFNPKNKFSKGAFLSTTILGFSLAILYLISGRNIAPCIIAHSLINLIIEPWLILAATSKKTRHNNG